MDILLKQVEEDTSMGFQFPLDHSLIKHVPHSILSLCGIVSQLNLYKHNNVIEKNRLTHNLSIDQSPKKSINNVMMW